MKQAKLFPFILFIVILLLLIQPTVMVLGHWQEFTVARLMDHNARLYMDSFKLLCRFQDAEIAATGDPPTSTDIHEFLNVVDETTVAGSAKSKIHAELAPFFAAAAASSTLPGRRYASAIDALIGFQSQAVHMPTTRGVGKRFISISQQLTALAQIGFAEYALTTARPISVDTRQSQRQLVVANSLLSSALLIISPKLQDDYNEIQQGLLDLVTPETFLSTMSVAHIRHSLQHYLAAEIETVSAQTAGIVSATRNEVFLSAMTLLFIALASLVAVYYLIATRTAHRRLAEHREHLEELVAERTVDLEKARAVAEHANLSKSNFLANMSHELRTPMNAILGFTQIMAKDHAVTEGQKENLSIILKSGEHLLSLINDILDLAKIESGRIELELQEFDLGALTQELIGMLKVQAENKGLELCLNQSSSFPRFIKSDPAKLRQIIINIVGNAIKFTQHGQIELKLNLLAQANKKNRNVLLFEISDTGRGIAADDIERIFDPFEQAKSKFLTEGTGLGLAITRQYISMLGGTITVDSTLGEGSTFCFTIAYESVAIDHTPALHLNLGEITSIDNAANCRILVVEDQLENRFLLKQLLIPYGFQYREAINGAEGVNIARQWHPHCILMDRRMPVMDGLAATRAICELGLDPQPAIIAVTAHAFAGERAEMLAAGCVDFLGKPFTDRDLYAFLERYLPVTIIRAVPPTDEAGVAIVPGLPAILSTLPAATIRQLEAAAIRCDVEQITDLLHSYPEVCNNLQPLLTSFRFDALSEAIGNLLQGKD